MSGRPEPLPADVFARRRERIFAELGANAMVLPGAPIRYRSRDSEYPYRPDNELYWSTGLTEPDTVAALLGHREEVRFVVFTRPRDPKAESWAGARLGTDGVRERTGADEVHPIGELGERLPTLLEGSERVLFRLDAHPEPVERAVRRALDVARRKGPRTGAGPRALVDPGEVLDDLRLIKDDHELGRMRRAAEISAEAFRALAAALRPGVGEWELQAALEAGFRAAGGDGPAFETIVASGPNACVLHHVALDRRVGGSDLVLVDAGAAWGLYASDITRTFPASGRWTPEQREIYELVDRARAAGIRAVRPGATVSEVHAAAHSTLASGLVDLGLLDHQTEPATEPDEAPLWYPHRTSHWLGLDVHDPGDYARGGEDRPLVPGMVLTVEPGLYLSEAAVEALGDRAAPYRGIGVRVEDDVLVTPGGHEVLTSHLPTDADEVAGLVG